MIRHFERQVDRLLGQEQRQTFLVQALEGLIRRIDHGRREPETRLVEQQECGIAHQGAPNREHLSFTTRHVANELPPPFGESRKHGINALEHLRRARLVLERCCAEQQVVLDGLRYEEAPSLGRECQPLAYDRIGRRACYIVPSTPSLGQSENAIIPPRTSRASSTATYSRPSRQRTTRSMR